MTDKQVQVLKEAINQYGIDNQIEMVTEECAELIQAIQKLKRAKFSIYLGEIPKNRTAKENLIYSSLCSEVADVKIMIAQMEIILNKEMVDLSVERKIERLSNRLLKQSEPC